MKAKKLDKKVVLNKTTIANLNNNELLKVMGGASRTTQCGITLCPFVCW